MRPDPKPVKVTKTKPKRSAGEKQARGRFREAARIQIVCQHQDCETRGEALFDAHHLLHDQHLRAFGVDRYDPRGAMRLHRGCHADHHARIRVIALSVFTDDQIAYVHEVLGEAAAGYLRRRYAVGPEDLRRLEEF